MIKLFDVVTMEVHGSGLEAGTMNDSLGVLRQTIAGRHKSRSIFATSELSAADIF